MTDKAYPMVKVVSDRFVEPGAAFMCRACLRERPASHTSPDPRYCRECYSFLNEEVSVGAKTGKWVPVHRVGMVASLMIFPGDRVQVVSVAQPDGVECWYVVASVDDGELTLTLQGIPAACPIKEQKVNLFEVFEHHAKEIQINGTKEEGKEQMENRELTAQENLERCRQKLTEATAANADPRVLGLWKSKVAQAEKLASTVKPVDPPAKAVKEPKAPKVPKEPKEPKPGAQPCQCGCDGMAASGRSFLPGHDAKFASYVRKYDAQKAKLEDFPPLVQAMISASHELVIKAREHDQPKK